MAREVACDACSKRARAKSQNLPQGFALVTIEVPLGGGKSMRDQLELCIGCAAIALDSVYKMRKEGETLSSIVAEAEEQAAKTISP